MKGMNDSVKDRLEDIVSRNSRMSIYQNFQSVKEFIVSNLQYRVSSILKNRDLSFFVEYSPKILRTFPENSEDSPIIHQKEGLF